ncbi:morphological differentiation-associated protein [Mycolicibacterium murale]|uniref:Morphological differentiation-associated protein n=1 Tax=Mycolicibacterium murale TaxID=182220 RepID=A0A7I9WDX5_9MYCO|nr:morphological differentiation-associated protein [Mycolicibacterium murale]
MLKSSYAQFLFLMSGADHEQMDRMRSYVTAMCTGWDVEQVKSIVGETLHGIVDPLVFAEAADLIADHKLCGRDVVVVSASGEEIVAPIARALGATHAMAGWWSRTAATPARWPSTTAKARRRPSGSSRIARAIRWSTATPTRIRSPTCRCWSAWAPTVVNPDRSLRREAVSRQWPVLTFSRPVSLRDRIPAPSGAAVATTAAVGISALAAGALTYSLLRRFAL